MAADRYGSGGGAGSWWWRVGVPRSGVDGGCSGRSGWRYRVLGVARRWPPRVYQVRLLTVSRVVVELSKAFQVVGQRFVGQGLPQGQRSTGSCGSAARSSQSSVRTSTRTATSLTSGKLGYQLPTWPRCRGPRWWRTGSRSASTSRSAQPVGSRWFHEAGGMRLSGRYLSFVERSPGAMITH